MTPHPDPVVEARIRHALAPYEGRLTPEALAEARRVLTVILTTHPVLAPLIHVVVLTLAISTGIPGALVIVLAGGMLFGLALGSILSTIGLTLGALMLPPPGAAARQRQRHRAGDQVSLFHANDCRKAASLRHGPRRPPV